MSQCVGAALLGVTVVSFNPYPADMRLGAQFEQHGPQLAVFQRNTTPVPPAMALPIENKRAHSIDQVFGIRMQFDSRSTRQRPKSLNCRNQFHL